MVDQFRGKKHQGFFAVFDGHGGQIFYISIYYTIFLLLFNIFLIFLTGKDAAEHCADRMSDLFMTLLEDEDAEPELMNLLKLLFIKVNFWIKSVIWNR